MTAAVERLAQHVAETQFEDLSLDAISAAKRFCLDTLGVCVAGTSAPYAATVQALASTWGKGTDASVLGLGHTLPAPAAALVNAFHTHNQEYDCVHEPAVVHPLTTIQAAALAYAERQGGVSGRDLILALVLGVDVATSIGMAAKSGLSFFRPATAGIFGVAAAVGKLAGLNQLAMLDAFGLAYAQAGGSMQAHDEGKPTLALQIGLAAAAGLKAVDLAQAGFPGPHNVLEGQFGYFKLFEGEWDLNPLWDEFGTVWRITQLSHKPFPTGRATHGGIDGILQLRTQHAIQAEDVATLVLKAPPLIHQLVGRPVQPAMQANYARLCFQYVGALALAHGKVEVPDFSHERLSDPNLLALGQRIEVAIDDNPDRNALSPQTVVAHLHNGTNYIAEVPDTLGSPRRPLAQDQYLNKFRNCLTYGVNSLAAEAPEQIIKLVNQLEDLDNTNHLIQPLCTPLN